MTVKRVTHCEVKITMKSGSKIVGFVDGGEDYHLTVYQNLDDKSRFYNVPTANIDFMFVKEYYGELN